MAGSASSARARRVQARQDVLLETTKRDQQEAKVAGRASAGIAEKEAKFTARASAGVAEKEEEVTARAPNGCAGKDGGC